MTRNHTKTHLTLFSLLLALVMLFSAPFATLSSASAASTDLSEYFTDRDLAGTWDEDKAISITLTGNSAECDASDVQISGSTVTIRSEGIYVISGELTDGSIIVDADDKDKVQLVLNGVSITSTTGAAILVENADKVFITLAPGTENTLSNTTGFDESSNVDAVIFSHDNLVLNGTGSLTVISTEGHGIVSKDDLKIASGTYTIEASKRGIDANDSIRVADGSITIVSGKDAIRCKNDEAEKGYIIIFGGTFNLTAGGGAENGAAHMDDMMGFGRWATSVSEGDTVSAKGIKASGNLTILGGSFTIDAADDGLHTDADLTLSSGAFTIASGDDGMHANEDLLIEDGVITIIKSYEGIEGKTITITGGDITVYADDDGMNAAGGSDSSGFGFYDMFASEDGVYILINGGSLYINATGDGIDSNGDLTVTGGTIVVSGPTSGRDAALDFNGTGTITGGTVIAACTSGMAEMFGSTSQQAAALVYLNGSAGTISVADANGNVLFSGQVEKNYDCVVISSPDLNVGSTYTVTSSSASTQVTLTDTITGGSSGNGWFGGGQGGFGGGGRGGHGR